ncbi:MAG: radical SAM family heme chaperone HemW [Nitrospirae bacterium]|nr:radical SAM family heme chaperone HemW [Nitrospirota bacterium]
MAIGLYIHVPFCRTRCHFCAFYLQIHRDDKAQRYLASLAREIRLHADLNSLGGRHLDTVYFGGGTPTTLLPDQLTGILELIRECFGLQERAEVTLEAHPNTVTAEGLRCLVRAGFTRISFGVQSMDDDELVLIGRRTHGTTARAAVVAARRAGFANINLDLIYGYPGQTIASWRATLDETIALEPTHLSCYAFTLEDHTRFQVDVRRGDRAEPDAEFQNVMEDEALRRLAAAGYERYEISNFSRPGYTCRHNLLYWQGDEYLGLGPSAQSYLNGCRFGNVDDLTAYHRALEAGRLPILEVEQLSPGQRVREAVAFGLRLTEGVDLGELSSDSMNGEWERTLNRLVERGWLEERSGRIRLTGLGRRFADSVAVELL